jgi:hypothetical protein
MIDLLKELYEKKITEDQAYDIFDEVVDRAHKGKLSHPINEEIKLDKYEWTASCHGIGFKTIAKWRYEGWPNTCPVCKKSINYKDYHWATKNNKLFHHECFMKLKQKNIIK